MKILVCDPVDLDALDLGSQFEVENKPAITKEELLQVVSAYQALIVRSRTKVDREVLDRATRLKLVARPGTGLDNVDVDYATSKGVEVVNSPESLVEAVAEHVTLLMLALSRKLTAADLSTRSGGWEKDALTGAELKGKSLGIVGLGRIGRRIAEIAGVLGMSIIAYDVVPVPPEVVERLRCTVTGLDDLLSASDYVTLHVPLSDETKHLIDSQRIARMKRAAYLINTSRGGVVDERALAKALREGLIAGAGLDVFEREPPAEEILSAPNTILTPHVGGQTKEAQVDAVALIGRKVRSFFSKK